MRIVSTIFLALSLIVPTIATAQTELLEQVSSQYKDVYPGLVSYRVKVKTNKLAEILDRMTASIPKDVPRPEKPDLMKFWNRKYGTVIRSMTVTSAPYQQQMIDRFSKRFAIDLGTLFLPAEKTEERKQLLAKASIKSATSEIAGERIQQFELTFKEPTNLGGAFYGTALELPQRAIKRLTIDIDTKRLTLVHLGIESEESSPLSIEVRHIEAGEDFLPSEVLITSPDGSIDERFVTTFKTIEGYLLPVKQERFFQHPGSDESLTAEFSDYELKLE